MRAIDPVLRAHSSIATTILRNLIVSLNIRRMISFRIR